MQLSSFESLALVLPLTMTLSPERAFNAWNSSEVSNAFIRWNSIRELHLSDSLQAPVGIRGPTHATWHSTALCDRTAV